jgi:hypothetical protein
MPEILHYIKCNDVPTSMTMGKRKHYLTSNLFYGGVHWMVRKKVVEMCKLYLLSEIKEPLKQVNPTKLPIKIEIVYHSARHTFDLDNKSSFWLKVLLDMIKEKKVVPDDNVKFISSICSKYYPLGKKENDILEIFLYAGE